MHDTEQYRTIQNHGRLRTRGRHLERGEHRSSSLKPLLFALQLLAQVRECKTFAHEPLDFLRSQSRESPKHDTRDAAFELAENGKVEVTRDIVDEPLHEREARSGRLDELDQAEYSSS